ncbi:hypothetical protein GNP79_12130 [Aliivibrio fischeri]|uniref:DUF2489 domain-containing protein n=2 Tax=Aliivibrio fischeri TaxID=668 RepID=A0A6N3YYG6_ALIFS|nr:hypothetical protein [Aliivibrio fischeri]MUK45676.1 hypothetical protein [Aliivibrio fischeri]MUK81538.1 hypothetical protein [Aliivibrio fischeri]MUK86598.1 hypothetical protein [Aliivibrio fischeri]
MPVEIALSIGLGAIIDGIKIWYERKDISDREKQDVLSAISSVMNACSQTRAYLYDIRELKLNTDRNRERELSQLWQNVANDIYPIDRPLAHSSQIKAMGWADPREWHSERAVGVPVKLDKLIEQCDWLKSQLEN